MIFVSPAKVNLFLKIIGKREDGCHELASLFQAIDLCDTLHYTPADSDRLTCTHSEIPTDNSNLVLKAIALFRQKTGIARHYHVHLEKRIPHQSGLGGGSSNAATTLWAMNNLHDSKIPLRQLMEWGGELGSDVPFFFSGGTAFCTGRGEKVQTLPSLPPMQLSVIKPALKLSTPHVYQNVDITTLSEHCPDHYLQRCLQGELSFFNDLETAAFTIAPQLIHLKNDVLERGGKEVTLSGSGSAFFCTGNVDLSGISGIEVFQVSFLNRSQEHWYSHGP